MRQSVLSVFLAVALLSAPLYAALPGVGVPEPPGVNLPANWGRDWCPQLRPHNGQWEGNAEANAAGFDWRTQCPANGWRGWFAEDFKCTEAAICLAYDTNLFGTKDLHAGNFRIENGNEPTCDRTDREFNIAAVFWDKGTAAYQLMYQLGVYPCKPATPPAIDPNQLPIIPGLAVQVLVGSQWIDDVVKSRSGLGIKLVSGRQVRSDAEGRTWRRSSGEPSPDPVPPPIINPPPPTPPPASQICPAGQACREPCQICKDCPECPPAVAAGVNELNLPASCRPWRTVLEIARVVKKRPDVAEHRRLKLAECLEAMNRILYPSQ